VALCGAMCQHELENPVMTDAVELREQPQAEQMYMIAGWRQWADAGSVSSGLPQYLIQQTGARPIGSIRGDGFYLFQIPGTHDLVRPVVKFDEGHPESLEEQRNELFYTGDEQRGVVFLLGDEPHLDMERYAASLLDVAETLKVKRIISLGGVYGELPYDKERSIGCVYSLLQMKEEVTRLAVNLSDYHGGASIGSYLCQRAGDRGMEFVGMYAFVPTYDFSSLAQRASNIRIENDFMAWLGVVKRINYMLKTQFDLDDLEAKSEQLLQVMDSKVSELENLAPQLNVREYMQRLSEEFTEMEFDPLDDVWEEELRRLLDEKEAGGTSEENVDDEDHEDEGD
jgi:proteasome assembly chaperone (PAC2) family protein